MINETVLLMRIIFVAAIVLFVLMAIALVAVFSKLKEMNDKVEEVNGRTKSILYDANSRARHESFMSNADMIRVNRQLSNIALKQERIERRLRMGPVVGCPVPMPPTPTPVPELTVDDLIKRTLEEDGRFTITYYNTMGEKLQRTSSRQFSDCIIIKYTKEYTLEGLILKVTI